MSATRSDMAIPAASAQVACMPEGVTRHMEAERLACALKRSVRYVVRVHGRAVARREDRIIGAG